MIIACLCNLYDANRSKDKVDFTVRGNEREDFGCVRLLKNELEEFVNCTGSYVGQYFSLLFREVIYL